MKYFRNKNTEDKKSKSIKDKKDKKVEGKVVMPNQLLKVIFETYQHQVFSDILQQFDNNSKYINSIENFMQTTVLLIMIHTI